MYGWLCFCFEEDKNSLSKIILPKKFTFTNEFHQRLYSNLKQMVIVETHCLNQSQTTIIKINLKYYIKYF